MKTKLTTALIACMLILGIAPQLGAQTHLNNLMKQCETKSTVDINVVMNRNKETGEINKVVKSVTINNDKRLVDDFLNAFGRDKEKATKIIENIKSGKTIPSLYQFTDGEKRVSYSFSLSDEANASVTYIERIGDSGFLLDIFGSNFDSVEFESQMEVFGKNMEAWGEEFGRKMEAWSAEYAPKMEAWAKEFAQKAENLAKEIDTTKMDKEERFFRGLPAE